MILSTSNVDALIETLSKEDRIPVGISNRHVHLSQEDMHTLFGYNTILNVFKPLKQTGQYAAKETIDIQGPKGTLKKVRVLGPLRSQTQVEISKTDSFAVGVKAHIRDSGDLAGTPGIRLIGPCGTVDINCGVIVAKRHIHMDEQYASRHKLADRQSVSVDICEGDRKMTMHDVLVRVHKDFVLEMHVDTDEANAAGLYNNAQVVIVK